VPYDLSLEPDHDRGGHIYRALLSGELEAEEVRHLSDWLADARQNPDASFVIDTSAVRNAGRRARLEMRTLIRRHADLRETRRLSVPSPLYPARSSRTFTPTRNHILRPSR
jgi:hypothetical protein